MYKIVNFKFNDVCTDDNGVYINSRSTKQMYHVHLDKRNMNVSSDIVHGQNGIYYYNRSGSCSYERVTVPLLFHFTKDMSTFSKFALEMMSVDRNIARLKKVGTDMDEAIHNGFKAVFPDVN